MVTMKTLLFSTLLFFLPCPWTAAKPQLWQAAGRLLAPSNKTMTIIQRMSSIDSFYTQHPDIQIEWGDLLVSSCLMECSVAFLVVHYINWKEIGEHWKCEKYISWEGFTYCLGCCSQQKLYNSRMTKPIVIIGEINMWTLQLLTLRRNGEQFWLFHQLQAKRSPVNQNILYVIYKFNVKHYMTWINPTSLWSCVSIGTSPSLAAFKTASVFLSNKPSLSLKVTNITAVSDSKSARN